MKTAALGILCVVTFFLVAGCEKKEREQKKTDLSGFQKTEWDMSADQVIKLYPSAKKNESMPGIDALTWNGMVAGFKAKTFFRFEGGKLTFVDIAFNIDVERKKPSLFNFLLEKYGPPEEIGKEMKRWDLGSTALFYGYQVNTAPALCYINSKHPSANPENLNQTKQEKKLEDQ